MFNTFTPARAHFASERRVAQERFDGSGQMRGVAVGHDGALLVSEDGNGTIWRISYAPP